MYGYNRNTVSEAGFRVGRSDLRKERYTMDNIGYIRLPELLNWFQSLLEWFYPAKPISK